MGELDSKPFFEAMKKKYNEEEAEDKASELCSLWEEYLKDPDWHPFKVTEVEGKAKVCLQLFGSLSFCLYWLYIISIACAFVYVF